MKLVLPLFVLTSLSLCSMERWSSSVEGVYLRFYNSHDGYRFSNAVEDSTYTINLFNTPYSPTWGIQGYVGYKSNLGDLLTRLSGFFFKDNCRPRTHMYPGLGYENSYVMGESSANSTNLNFTPLTLLGKYNDYQGSLVGNNPLGGLRVGGVMIDQYFQDNFNSLDFSMAPELKLKPFLILRPLMGIGGLITNFKQSYTKYTQQGTFPIPGSTAYLLVQSQYSSQTQFNAIGPELGMDLLFNLSKNLYFDINATFRWLWGNKKSNLKESYLYDVSGSIVNSQGSLQRNATVCQADYVFNAKFCAQALLKNETQALGVTMGYKFEILPQFFTLAYSQSALPDAGVDFMLQGLTVGTFYKF